MMLVLFYIAAAVAVTSALLALTLSNATHALIFLIVSLLGMAVIFFLLGAPFAAALEVVIYAGAIMVLFVFVVMMLNLDPEAQAQEQSLLSFKYWWGPGLLSGILLAELLVALNTTHHAVGGDAVLPKTVALSLFGPYMLGVELASMLLLSGLVGAYHLGRDFLVRKGDPSS